MIFRKAEKEDFYKIRSLYWTLIDQEQDDPSFPHWKKGIHPSDEMIQDSIDTRQLYVLSDDEKIAACVIANDEKVDGYAGAPWQIDSDEVIVLHVLAVHPDHRGKGLARRLVENVIEQERKAGNSVEVSPDFLSDTAEYDIWLPESEMQIGGFLQQLVLEVLSVLPVKQELQVRQVQSVLRVLDLYLCSYDSLPPLLRFARSKVSSSSMPRH